MNAQPGVRSTLFTPVRAVFITLTALLVLAFLAEVALTPGYISSSYSLSPPNITWTVEATRAALAEVGWSEQGYAWFEYVRQVIIGPISIVLALLLWRKSDHWVGLYTAFLFAAGSVGASPLSDALLHALPALSGIYHFLGNVSWQLGFILFFFFPDGRFVPRWTRWLLALWVAYNVFAGAGGGEGSPAGTLSMLGGSALVFTALGSQVYRYQRRSGAVQRQQTKWVLFSIIVMIIVLPFSPMPFLMPEVFGRQGASSLLLTELSKASAQVAFAFFPLSLTIAILRYRLWDVDVIIRRTVTYALLTALLLVTFFGSVVALQQLLVALTGQRQELAVILSTLGIYALFGPLRNRIQSAIDHRFFRAKYDAQQALAAFAAATRDEADMGRLSARLLDGVDETLKPAGLSLWLQAAGDEVRTRKGEQP